MGRGWHPAAQATASRLLLRGSRAERENTAAFIHLHNVRGCSYATAAAASCFSRDCGAHTGQNRSCLTFLGSLLAPMLGH